MRQRETSTGSVRSGTPTRRRGSARRLLLALLVCVSVTGAASCAGPGSGDGDSSPSRSQPAGHADHGPERRGSGGKPVQESARPRTHWVAHVVDGDTLTLGNGETVRLVGIDTPEVGACGYDRAAAMLERLVLSKQVRLTASVEDKDRYGRLLRYVDVGTEDAGLRLIEDGLAVARYDSRDGYDYHPRQPRYVTADRASRRDDPDPDGDGAGCG